LGKRGGKAGWRGWRGKIFLHFYPVELTLKYEKHNEILTHVNKILTKSCCLTHTLILICACGKRGIFHAHRFNFEPTFFKGMTL
jgi:hypothetical protein